MENLLFPVLSTSKFQLVELLAHPLKTNQNNPANLCFRKKKGSSTELPLSFSMQEMGLEPTRYCYHWNLNHQNDSAIDRI